MAAAIISIGNELCSGLTVNTNATWLSAQLAAIGIPVDLHVTVPDAAPAITAALVAAAKTATLLLVSGGLGPTEDDLTRRALADAMGEPLVEDAGAMAALEALFEARKRPMSASNRVQAQRPKSAQCIPNAAGTAPGIRGKLDGVPFYVMPGVPREMKQMFADHVAIDLRRMAGQQVVLTGRVNMFGAGESFIGEQIADLMARSATPTVGTTVAEGIVSARIYASGTPEQASALLAQTTDTICQRLGPLVYSRGEKTLQEEVSELLGGRKLTVATAESCTGGMLAGMFTDVPGSGTIFMGGFVTYNNTRKQEDLAVPEALLQRHGAVSREAAEAMATGVRKRTGASWGLSVTGVAGPDQVEGKPVGLVYIGIADAREAAVFEHHFGGDRAQVRQRAAQMALARLRWKLLGAETPPGV